jgi:hypothetical protein
MKKNNSFDADFRDKISVLLKNFNQVFLLKMKSGLGLEIQGFDFFSLLIF